MTKRSPEELRAESLRSGAMIRKGSEAELRGIEELSKRRFSLEQMRTAVKRHHRESAQMWNQGPTPFTDIPPDKEC
ncbi:MAG: hypothetical protein ABI539_15240 [Acidobacteriota bacterium]